MFPHSGLSDGGSAAKGPPLGDGTCPQQTLNRCEGASREKTGLLLHRFPAAVEGRGSPVPWRSPTLAEIMTIRFLTSIACMLLLAGCPKPPAPPAPATPKPVAKVKPVPTPHPAQAATETAIRLYPDLAKKDSTFNRAFREIYQERRDRDPASLANFDWPLDVARRAAAMLEVSPANPEPPPPPPPPVVIVATPAPVKALNPLDRGAYDQRREVARPPVMLDRSGHRVPMRSP